MTKTHGSCPHVVDQFEAEELGAPFKVFLHDCVKVVTDDESGEILSYTIPDPDGLLRIVVLSRILNRRKLAGPELKFLRKAVGLKQKDVAKSVDLSVEHLSKCESGKLVLSGNSEILLRVFLLKTAIKHHKIKDSEAKAKIEGFLDTLFDEPLIGVHDAEDELVFRFCRGPNVRADNDDEEPEYQLKSSCG
jgi:Predicted transcriptional regulator